MKINVEMAPAMPKFCPASWNETRKVNEPRMSVCPAGTIVPGMSGAPRVSSRISTILLKLKAKLEISSGTNGGRICGTPGNVIDYTAVTDYLRELCARFDVRELNFDPAYAQPVMAPLLAEGLPVQTMRQGWVTQSPALNELERVILGGNFRHGGHPVLRWCFANVAIYTDSAGNRTMHKGKSTGRIDGAVATWMAVSRAVANDNAPTAWDDPDFIKNLYAA